MDDTPLAIGLRLRELRGALSQAEAAVLCEMTQVNWSKLERGRFVKTSALPLIARKFMVRVDWLARGVGPKREQASPSIPTQPTAEQTGVAEQAAQYQALAEAKLNRSNAATLRAALRPGALSRAELRLLAALAGYLMSNEKTATQ